LTPETTPIRPSAWWYWLALPFFFAGIALFLHEITHGMRQVVDSMTRVVVPGQATLNLEGNRSYTVFYESHTVVDGKLYSTHQSVSSLQCQVRSSADGMKLDTNPASPTQYKIAGRTGNAFLEFSVAHDGPYDFSCVYASGIHGTSVVLAIGAGVGARMFRVILASFAGMILGPILSLAVFFWIYIRRDNAKARAAAAALR
jgi:hypothetical protein